MLNPGNTNAERSKSLSDSIFHGKGRNNPSPGKPLSLPGPLFANYIPTECEKHPENCEVQTRREWNDQARNLYVEAWNYWEEEDKKCEVMGKRDCAGSAPNYHDYEQPEKHWRVKDKPNQSSDSSSNNNSSSVSSEGNGDSSDSGSSSSMLSWYNSDSACGFFYQLFEGDDPQVCAKEQKEAKTKREEGYNNLSKPAKHAYTLFDIAAGSSLLWGPALGYLLYGIPGLGWAALGGLGLTLFSMSTYDHPGRFHENLGFAMYSPLALSYGLTSGVVHTATLGFVSLPAWGSKDSKGASQSLYYLYSASKIAAQATALAGGVALGAGAFGAPVLTGYAGAVGSPTALGAGALSTTSGLVQTTRWGYNRHQDNLYQQEQQEEQEKLKQQISLGTDQNMKRFNDSLNTIASQPKELESKEQELRLINEAIRSTGIHIVVNVAPQNLSADAGQIAQQKRLIVNAQGNIETSVYGSKDSAQDIAKFKANVEEVPAQGTLVSVPEEIRQMQYSSRGVCRDKEGCLKIHGGYDWANKLGTPVRATDKETVVAIGYDKLGYGHFVLTDTGVNKQGDRVFKLKGHFGSNQDIKQTGSILAREGQTLEKHEIIGLMGNSGHVTGAHVHDETFLVPADAPERVKIEESEKIISDLLEKYKSAPPERWLKDDFDTYKKAKTAITSGLFDMKPFVSDSETGKIIYAKPFSEATQRLKKEQDRITNEKSNSP